MPTPSKDQSKPNALLVDYETLVTNPQEALKKITGFFEKNGAVVSTVELDKTQKRSASYTYRLVHLGFPDSQIVSLGVTKNGDIFKVKINGKDFAVHNQKDQTESIKEIVGALNKGRAKWQRKLAAIKEPTASKKVTMSLKAKTADSHARLAIAQQAMQEATQQETDLTNQLSSISDNVVAVQHEIQDLKNQITSRKGNAA